MNDVKELKELEGAIEQLGNSLTAYWEEGLEKLTPLPDEPTVAQLRDALLMTRGDAAEVGKEVLAVLAKLQGQVAWLDRALKDHRHQNETGSYSSKPEF